MHTINKTDTTPRYIVIRYSEIALKGKNRIWFEDMLIRNIRRHLSALEKCKVTKIYGRILIETPGAVESIADILQYVPGIANFSFVESASHNIEDISAKAAALIDFRIKRHPGGKIGFKVESKRSEKRFPMNSLELSARIGGELIRRFPQLKVDLHNPEIRLGIEIWQKNRSILYLKKQPGQGGLPVGTAGNVLSFLSGGIDSPVSSWFMMKRGCSVTFVHFDSAPFTSEQSRQKTIDLVVHLSRFQPRSELLIVPFADIQKAIREKCEESSRTILYRRFMYRVANAVRKKYKTLAYVTGEALGQVASQTMENIACTEDAAEIPILRPLIGLEKAEIVEWSKRIGTFPISIRPFPDCCTVFQPRKPEIHGEVERIRQEESKVDSEKLLENCLSRLESMSFETRILDRYWD